MTTELTKAAQQVLEALKNVTDYDQINAARRALQSALTQRSAAQEVDYSEQLTKAKRLLVDLHKIGGAEVRSMIEARTGPWFVWGQDRAYLPAPQQATPEQFADASKMVPPVALRSVRLTRDTAGMCVVRVNGRVAIRDNGDIIDHTATLEWFADTQQATPEPVGSLTVYVSAQQFESAANGVLPGMGADDYKTGECGAYLPVRHVPGGKFTQPVAVCTRPAPGVPDGFALVPVEPTPEMKAEGIKVEVYSEASDSIGALTWAEVAAIYRSMLAAAQAKGGQP